MPVDLARGTSFPTTVCPNCGYALDGPADAGTCPECGGTYDQTQVILYGWARGRFESLANAPQSRVFARLGFPAFIAVFVIVVVPTWDAKVMGAAVLLGAGYFLLYRQRSSHPGLIQVRLDDKGCVQYNDLTGPSALRELYWSYVWVLPIIAFACIAAAAFAKHAWLELRVWLLVAVFAEWYALRKYRRLRAARRNMRDGAIADINSVECTPTSWAEIFNFSLAPLTDDHYRLQIQRDRGMYGRSREGNFGEYVVDAEVRLTWEQVKELKQLVSKLIAQGHANAAK